jgi:hypothetical protein
VLFAGVTVTMMLLSTSRFPPGSRDPDEFVRGADPEAFIAGPERIAEIPEAGQLRFRVELEKVSGVV